MWNVIPDSPPDREQLQGLGLALALPAGLLALGLAAAAGLPAAGAAVPAVLVAAACGVYAWRRPHRLEGLHRLWRRAAAAYARRARKAVLAILYHTVVVAAGALPSDLRLRPEGEDESQWTPRTTLPPEEYGGQGGGLPAARTGPSGDLLAWARSSGRLWAVFLIPFLLLLAAFDPHDAPSAPDSIYTLY